jgi:hypothetical protein
MIADSRQKTRDPKIYASLGHYLLDGDHQWQRPTDSGPGDWMPAYEGELEPWKNAYPLYRGARQLLNRLGSEIFEAEVDGEVIEDERLIHARRARLLAKTAWDERSALLFAIECAERVLPLFEKVNPREARPRRGLEAARAHIDGKIDQASFETAAKGVRAAVLDAVMAEEDIRWGSTAEERQREAEAGSPTWVALYAVKAAGSAVDRGEYKRHWTGSSSAHHAVSNAVHAFERAGDVAGAETETAWQARRLLDYL